jgi:Ca2+-binding RTX toxin-like protein
MVAFVPHNGYTETKDKLRRSLTRLTFVPLNFFQKPQVEALEKRRLLATVSWSDGLVTIVGTEGDDALVFRSDGSDYVVEGSDARIPQAEAQRLAVRLLGGDDYFLNSSALPAQISGGEGNDTLVGGSATDSLFGNDGSDHIYGEGGDDFLDGGGQADDFLQGGEGLDQCAGVTTATVFGIFTLLGSAGADEIIVRNVNGFWELDGAGQRVPISGDGLTVRLGDGNDRFTNESSSGIGVYGGNGDDVLIGSAAHPNSLYGEAGDDVLDSRSGLTDHLDGGTGEDVLDGSSQIDQFYWAGSTLYVFAVETGANLTLESRDSKFYVSGMSSRWPLPDLVRLKGGGGDDQLINRTSTPAEITGASGDDLLWGGTGNDVLTGDAGDDVLFGGAGDDVLNGRTQNDRLFGGDGNDVYEQWSSPTLDRDSIKDSGGIDRLQFSTPTVLEFDGGQGVALLSGSRLRVSASAADVIIGSNGDDTLEASRFTQRIEGGRGNDILAGRVGAQTLLGNDGNDVLRGMDGDDQLYGGNGNDVLDGGAGDDNYVFDKSIAVEVDTLLDSAGDNAIDFRLTTLGVTMDAAASMEFAVDAQRKIHRTLLDSNGLFTTIYGTGGVDQIFASGSVGTRIFAGEGRNTIRGSDGDDYVESGSSADTLMGGAGNDVLSSGGGNDVITGGDGDDQLLAGLGNDGLNGGGGSDLLDGAAGNDVFVFDTPSLVSENDQLRDSAGNNTLDFRTSTVGVRIDASATAGFATDARRNVDRVLQETSGVFGFIYGGSGDDEIIAAGTAGTRIETGNGNNVVVGSAGNDYIMGGLGNDTLRGEGGALDQIFGREGDDVIYGGDGEDWIVGGVGSDTIHGGAGRDIIYGGDPGNSSLIAIPYARSDKDGPDILLGELGMDTLIGGPGIDELDGGPDADELHLAERFSGVPDEDRPVFG